MTETYPQPDDERGLETLLAEAGPRPPLPADDLAAIRDAARAAWHRRWGDRRADDRGDDRGDGRRWRRWVPLAAAAALAAAVGLAWWVGGREPVAPPPAVASVELAGGAVRVAEEAGGGLVPLAPDAAGRPLAAGAEIETAGGGAGGAGVTGEPGRLALRLAGGASLRLDAGTRVRLVSAVRIELERGAVYVDSGSAAGGGRSQRVAVSTPAGVFEEIGTQFEVRIEPGPGVDRAAATTRLRVREGRVSLDRGAGAGAGAEPLVAAAGEALEIGGDGRVVRRPAPVRGPEWGWVLATAPMLDIEGITVREFLDWVARETGWRVELADPRTAAIVETTELHGSFGRLTPAEAPGPVLASCGLDHRVEDGALVVFPAAGY